MVRLTCQCLNVNLHVKGSRPSYTEDQSTSLASLVGEDDESKNLHYLKLWEVTLDVGGASVKLSPLLMVQSLKNWLLYKCCNCDSFTHLVESPQPPSSSSRARILVTHTMECDSAKILEMEQVKGFSPIFKIILGGEGRDRDEEHDQSQFRKRVSSLNYGRDDPTLKHIHEDMKSFLQEEQDCMEARVRRFEEEQRRVYAELQARAHTERSIIFRLITTARESSTLRPESVAPPTLSTATLRSSSPPPAGKSDDTAAASRLHQSSQTHSRKNRSEAPPQQQQQQKQQKKQQQQQQQQQQQKKKDDNDPREPGDPLAPSFFRRRSVEDEEDLFGNMDDFEQEEEAEDFASPLSQSDEDSAFTDDSFRDDTTEDSVGPNQPSTMARSVAHSVPVSMPMFSRKSPKKSSAEQDEEKPPISYEKMAASIQALALSCHDTGMFGDLPKPRLNSIPWRL